MSFDKEKYKKKGSFFLSSGQSSDFYYDIKEAMGTPQNLKRMYADFKLDLPLYFDLFIGLDYGGIPLAVTCSIMTGKPYAILRKKQKPYGTMKVIEGYQGKGKVVLLDDVSTTGKSLKSAEGYLTSQGYEIIKSIVIVDRKT